jgi:hypothetical protein
MEGERCSEFIEVERKYVLEEIKRVSVIHL